MMNRLALSLAALLALLRGVRSQLDFTIGESPTYGATASGTEITITGSYGIGAGSTSETHSYTQELFTVDAGVCTATSVTPVSPASTPVATANSLSAEFTVNLAATGSSAYYTVVEPTGTVELCHRIKVSNGALLMNQVDTVVTATIALSATFGTATVTTTTSTPLTGTAEGVSLAASVSATATPTQLSAGTPLSVNITSDYPFTLSSATLSGGVDLMGSGTNHLASNNCVATAVTTCILQITLGFSYFVTAANLDISGEVLLDLTANSEIRRLEETQELESVPFKVAFSTVENNLDSAGSITATAAGGLMAMAVMALV